MVAVGRAIEGICDMVEAVDEESGERQYTWYIEPLDPMANGEVARLLENHDGSEASICCGIKCADGRARDLWRLGDYGIITLLNNSRAQYHFRFKVWVQEGTGKIKLFAPKSKQGINLEALVKRGVSKPKPKAKAKPR